MARGGDTVPVRVWDRPVRLFHWALVLVLAGSWYTAENGMTEWHERCGLAAIALVVFRLIWGVVGGHHARFATFLSGPIAVYLYLRETMAGRHPVLPGHNPLGGWSVILMLLAIGVQASMGLFGTDDILYEGPLASLVSYETSTKLTGWHHLFFNVVLALVVLHVLAVAAYAVFLKNDLIRPMFTGRKRLPLERAPGSVRRTPAWVAALLFAGCAAAAWAITLVG